MHSRKITIHHRSEDDASYHVRQYPRMATSLLHNPFSFRVNHMSADMAPNANAVALLNE
jgi:hypothetical protein